MIGESIVTPNFVSTSPNFCQIKVEYCCLSNIDLNVLQTYSGWDAKKDFKWITDFAFEPIWIIMDTMLYAWELQKSFKSEAMIVSQKHIDFTKDDLACVFAIVNDVEYGNKPKHEDVDWYQKILASLC